MRVAADVVSIYMSKTIRIDGVRRPIDSNLMSPKEI